MKKRESITSVGKKLDAVFSRYIRELDGWTCVRCGNSYEPGSQGLHCSHIFSRRHKAIRWDERNSVAHCFACHAWYGGNPVEGGRWAVEYLGEETIDTLIRLKEQGRKWTVPELKELLAEFKQ